MKRTGLIVGGVILVLVLAGGAYMGGRLLTQRSQVGAADGGIIAGGAGGGGQTMITRPSIKPAPELPQTPADARGTFVRREDRSIYVGTGQITFGAVGGAGQSGSQVNSSSDGPVVEVVVNQDTEVFRDTTQMPGISQSANVREVQQTVEPGTIDDIGENSIIQVWGRKTGDRIVAQVLVYSEPTIMIRPPSR